MEWFDGHSDWCFGGFHIFRAGFTDGTKLDCMLCFQMHSETSMQLFYFFTIV